MTKITADQQEYNCPKCNAPLGKPITADYLPEEIYLYFVCLKCETEHCAAFVLSSFVTFPKVEK